MLDKLPLPSFRPLAHVLYNVLLVFIDDLVFLGSLSSSVSWSQYHFHALIAAVALSLILN